MVLVLCMWHVFFGLKEGMEQHVALGPSLCVRFCQVSILGLTAKSYSFQFFMGWWGYIT